MEIRALSVSEVSNYVTRVFEAEEMLQDIKIFGEISTFQIKSGIAYYTLKDASAIINCITFGAEKYSNLNIGDQVVLTGSVRYYGKGGRLNFNAYKIEAQGQGEIYKQFLLLKEELEKAGYFDLAHKKPLPNDIKKIGVVTSSTGAVINDIINVATRRNPAINIVLYPAKVQGVGADLTIIQGIEYFENTDVDVVLVARGGGSYEDLQPFNSRLLAECVYNASKVIVSAIGHEPDFTIIDFVADKRAPTPSAGAELLTKDVMSEIEKIEKDKLRLYTAMNALLERKGLLIQDYRESISEIMLDNLYNKKIALQNNATKLQLLAFNVVNKTNAVVDLFANSLDNLSPIKILKKGYSKVYKDNAVITSKKSLKINDEVELAFADGKVKSKIVDVEV